MLVLYPQLRLRLEEYAPHLGQRTPDGFAQRRQRKIIAIKEYIVLTDHERQCIYFQKQRWFVINRRQLCHRLPVSIEMARFQGRRQGLKRGRAGKVSFTHGTSRNHNNKNNFKELGSLQEPIRGKPHQDRSKVKQNNHQTHKSFAPTDGHKQRHSLEDDLDSILHADTLAKHIDPPFAELEDDFSRLKTQSIQLATLVLHLQNTLESGQNRHRKTPPPQTIAIGRSLPPDFLNSNAIKTTTIKAPSIATTHRFTNETLSIIHSSIPKLWSPKPTATKTPKSAKSPKIPGTAGWVGSPMSVHMASPFTTQLTPTLDRLLDEVHEAIQNRDGDRIAADLQLEPPLAQAYSDLQKELKTHYPWGKDKHLRTLCEGVLPKGPDDRKTWESFAGHLLQYLQFIRDYAPNNLLKYNNDLKRLLMWVRHTPIPTVISADACFSTSCICLSDTAFGVVILPSVLGLSRVLARLAVGLDKRPELVVQLLRDQSIGDNEAIKTKVTFVEDAANTIREAFIKCLSDKSGPGGFGRNAAPEGKRTGIYLTGNLCLKLLFQCRKLSTATTMFVSIDAQSPLLSHYPAPQRVTYLYYLGRYLFANNHFFRAQLALQAAYDQCHAQALRHRRLILMYLIAANICLGRFPSSKLLLRREAADLAKYFLPLCRLIASGDLSGFIQYLSLENPHGKWFLSKRLLLQLRNRCEPLVWRSLARRAFIEVGFPGGEDNKTPFLRLPLLQAAAQWLEKRRPRPSLQETAANSQKLHSRFHDHAQVQSESDSRNRVRANIDPEFAGMEDAIAETGFDPEAGTYITSSEHLREQSRSNGVSIKHSKNETRPTLEEVESIMASLIQQDLIVGFLTHNNPRFAIPGAKTRGALAVGFPPVWDVIKARKRSSEVPGWVKDDERPNVPGGGLFGGFGGGGRVVNLSGARPVGAEGA
jgi:nuclear mRNA export protein PCID2/THP1